MMIIIIINIINIKKRLVSNEATLTEIFTVNVSYNLR